VAILGLMSEEASSSPKDDDLDEVNEAILLALSDEPFSCVFSVRQIADSPQDMRSKTHSISSVVDSLHFAIRHQTASLGPFKALRESEGKRSHVESN
jgi:hypothetical protein